MSRTQGEGRAPAEKAGSIITPAPIRIAERKARLAEEAEWAARSSEVVVKKGRQVTEKLYTVEEVADIVKVTEWTVREWLKAGSLVGFKVKRAWRIKESDFKTFLNERHGDS